MKNAWMMLAVAALVVTGWGVAYADHHEGPSGEFRWLYWSSNNDKDSNDKLDDSNQVNKVRARIGQRFSGGEGLSGMVQGQVNHTLGTIGAINGDTDGDGTVGDVGDTPGAGDTDGDGTVGDKGDKPAASFVVKQAWFAWQCSKNTAWTLYGGREVYAKGGGRIFGKGDWTDSGFGYDGLRLNKHDDSGSLDIFAYTVNEKGRSPGTTGESSLYGAYYDCAKTGIDGYAVWTKSQGASPAVDTDNIDFWTLGGRWDGSVGEYSVDAEVAIQSGDAVDPNGTGANLKTGNHSSSLLHVGVKAPAGPLTVNVDLDVIGGDGKDDGKSKGWMDIAQDNHNLYGYQDLFGAGFGKNGTSGLTHLGIGARFAKSATSGLNAAFHTYTLAEKVAKTATAEGDDAGTEIDLWADKKINDNAALLVIYSIYNPGDAVVKNADAVTLFAIELKISF